MIEIENIFPYTIVKGEDGFGIIDANKNVVVPCVMDNIINGKYVEPKFISCDIFPFDEGEIHVKTEDGYGVFKSPEYIFEEISSTGKKTLNDNPYTIKQALEDILP